MKEKKVALFNKLGREELEEELNNENFKRVTVSLYRYVDIKNPEFFRDILYASWLEFNIKGRIYLAKEGINAQFSCPEDNWEAFTKSLEDFDYLKDVPLTIKVRHKILADGMDDGSYDTANVGTHLTAAEWNKHMADPNTIIVDVRNHYENEIGHFKGSICTSSDTFKEDLPKIHDTLKGKEDQKILLYCTGGIRCEKTSAFLKHEGFEDVNQLHGGIIDYARQIEAQGLENNFIGKNFVFDERRGERISDDVISACHQCGESCDEHTNCDYLDCNLLFIQCEKCKTKYNHYCSIECSDNSKLPIEEQKALRKKREAEGLQEYSKSLRPKINRLE